MPGLAHTPLLTGKPLIHDEGACLPLRSRHGQCRACEQACPAQAIAVSLGAVTLSPDCTGCGQCTAACPTGALALPELIDWPGPAPAGVVRIECRKVPSQQHGPGTQTVPCLGAVTVGQLLSQAAAGVRVSVVDRGWCAGCECRPRGCSEDGHAAAAAVHMAREWLQAVGGGTIDVIAAPLDPQKRPAEIPEAPAAPGPELSRRSFFRAAVEKPAGRQRSASPMGGDGRAAYPAEDRQPSPERTRQHAALSALALRGSTEIPREFFPALHLVGDCCDRRMCVALCPTAALTVADDGASACLQFDPVRCIACGACERACPESALALSAHGGTGEVRPLIGHRRLQCRSCGDAYTQQVADDTPPAATCPACAKSQRFMDDARRQLFGAFPTSTPRSN